MKTGLLCIIFLLIPFGNGIAQGTLPRVYPITSDTIDYIFLPDPCWQAMSDPGGDLSFTQILHAVQFNQTDEKINYKYNVYWIRFKLLNTLSKDIRIAFTERAAKADLYTQLNESPWKHHITGTMVRWSKRSGLKRVPAFMLTIPAGDTLTTYQRIYWNYVAAQPDSLSIGFAPAERFIQQDYIHSDTVFMTSLQDAFILGLFILSMIISFYFFLVVREKEFLYFSIYLLLASLESISSLNDVFFREYPQFLLYLYIFSNSLVAFALIHALRWFLKTFDHFPKWDKILIVFSFLQVVVLLASHFASPIFHANLGAPSHLSYNLVMLIEVVILLITLFLYVRKHERAIRLMIAAYTPILLLGAGAYIELIVYGLYAPRFGAPTVSGYVTPFNKVAFFILILCILWMIVFFNWVMFLRFYNIRRKFIQQTSLDQLKSHFFTNISHEFRTPLTMIIGPLEDSMRGEDPAGLIKTVPAMYRNSKRLLQLINQLLDLSKLDASNYKVNTTRDDIIPFITQIVSSFSSMAERKNIHLELNVDPDLSIALEIENTFFYFDEDIMEKIVSNLLSNAMKFTEKGGEITVSLGLANDKKEFMELKVADSGIGIPAGKLPYIFDRFYQADPTSKRQYEGSGIGLSLVKELVELHGGTITASSRQNKGAIFTCLLPFNKKILTDKAIASEKKTTFTDMPVTEAEEESTGDNLNTGQTNEDQPQVLIVEDNEDVRKYIAEKLQDQFAILEAGNGKEGLEKALAAIPDLVISDVMMPEMDGFELCKRLKTDDRTSHIPVILLTARAEDSDKISGLENGADAYLIKPFNAKELNIRVHNLIALRNKLRSKFSDKLTIRPSEITVTTRDQMFMQKLLSMVESRLDDAQFSVEQLAGEMNMSGSQLYQKLKAIINQTPKQFISSIRMQRALEFLRSDGISVAEVSWKVGFEDPGYFTRVFKNHFGCLPTEKEKFPD